MIARPSAHPLRGEREEVEFALKTKGNPIGDRCQTASKMLAAMEKSAALMPETLCIKMLNIKSISVIDMQHHFGKVLAWVENGEEAQITRRSKPVARLIPSSPASTAPVSLPDFAARARAIWGAQSKGRGLSKAILAEREERL